MTHEYVNPSELARPSGYSHAVSAAPGQTVYLAGQTALSPDGRIVGGGTNPDVVVQFEQCLSNLLKALWASGGGPEHLVSTRIYLVDVDGYRRRSAEIGAVWRRLIGARFPAMAAIGVARLWDADALVEIEGVAVID